MRSILLVSVPWVTLVTLALVTLVGESPCSAKDLIVGTSYNSRLVWQQKAEYNAIPFKKRVKEVFYSDPNQQVLKGVIARDADRSAASATLTAGGVGFSYANLRLKSERGGALNYQIEFYA